MESRRRYINPGLAALPVQPVSPAQLPVQSNPEIALPARAAPLPFPWANPEILDHSPAGPNSTQLPSYFRSTVTVFPATPAVESSAGEPLGLIINPAQVVDIPTIDYSSTSRLDRCSRCVAYLSPYSAITGDGRSWQCPFCGAVNQTNDLALASRTELHAPVYDMIAPPAFRMDEDHGPCFMFLIDVSRDAVASTFTANCLNSIKVSIDSLEDNVRIGLMTMGNSVSVYDFRREKVFVVGDLSDPCVPAQAVVELGSCRDRFKQVLDELLAGLGQDPSPGHCYGSALTVAEKAMTGHGGVLIACFAGIPTLGPHAVNARPCDISVPEEKLLHLPEDGSGKYYREIGFALNRTGVSVHVFNIPGNGQRTSELAVIGIPSNLTAGVVHCYKEYDPLALHTDLFETLTAPYLWDASMRVRMTAGVETKGFIGNFTTRDKTLHFPVLCAQHSVTYELKVQEAIKTPRVLFQCAILWTSTDFKRLIRIFTFELPTSNQSHVVKQMIDEAAMAVFLMKKTIPLVVSQGPTAAANSIQTLFNNVSLGQTYQYIHHFVQGLLRSELLRPAQFPGVDVRYTMLTTARSMSFVDSLLFLYPQMFAVDGADEPIPLSTQSFAMGNIILVHRYNRVLVWISPATPPEKLRAFFGCGSSQELPTEVPQISTPENQHLNDMINRCHMLSRRYLPVEVIPPGSPREAVFGEIIVGRTG